MKNDSIKNQNIFLEYVGLQNFQTFSEYQEIPIGELTYIYGPNSAGKSALIDAIEIMHDLWSNEDSDSLSPSPFFQNLPPKFLSAIRRESGNRLSPNVTRLVAEISLTKDELFKFLELESYNPEHHWVGEVLSLDGFESNSEKFKVRAEVRTKGDHSPRSIDEIYLSVAGSPLLQYQPLALSINLQHPWLSSSEVLLKSNRLGISKAISQIEKPGGFFQFNDGWLSYCNAFHCVPNRTVSLHENFYFYIEDAINEFDEEIQSSLDGDEVFQAFIKFGRAYNELIGFFSKLISKGLIIERVLGSRTVPRRQELTYLVTSSKPYEINPSDYGIIINSDPRYRDLAISNLIRFFEESSSRHKFSTNVKEIIDYSVRFGSTQLIEHVNEALRDHLLLDRSYQVIAEIKLLINLNEVFDNNEKIQPHSLYGPYLVTLALIDPSGNKFDFDEVGSGIGYVLPILLSINSTTLTVIEQPELHLHPALQGALSDVFIEACNRGSRMIVESHSEYALLRALRRIRQTSHDKSQSSSLRLRPDQICVLYFEPSINGGTKVKRIRVSREGDFLDYWPNGFFDERRKDLFDE